MKIVTITGSTGFVGKNLTHYLEDSDVSVRALSLRSSYEDWNLQNSYAVIHLAGKAHDLKNVAKPGEYYKVNTELSKQIFDAFLLSDASVFVMLSSVKAVRDSVDNDILTEDMLPAPGTVYGKSKLLAEEYIAQQQIPANKRVYILRPCMIHGPGNKGNLNLLYQLVRKKIPWPLGRFENQRSFLSIENLCFVIQNLTDNSAIPSGVYQVADDEPLSTNELIGIIAQALETRTRILHIPKYIIRSIARIGGVLHLPLTPERLQKLTESYIVSNKKLLKAMNKQLPVGSREGLLKTIRSFVYD